MSGGEKRRPNLWLVPDASAPPRDARIAEPDDPDAVDAALLSKDRGALRALVAENAGVVLAIVRRYARTPQDARELVHRTFVRALAAARRALRRDPERALSFRRSLLRTALAVVRIHLRREVHFAHALVEQLGPADARASAGVLALVPERRVAIARASVLQLQRRRREALTLALDAGLPIAEIGRVLGITPRAARANVAAASLWVRAALPGAEVPACCPGLAEDLSLRGAGALDGAGWARVAAHVAGCRPCAHEASAIAEALATASLAPPSAAERRALEDLPSDVLASSRRDRSLRGVRAVAFAAAATLAAGVAVALAFLR